MAIFPHSNLRTDYSFLETPHTPSSLINGAQWDAPIAIADTDTLASGLDLHKLSKKTKGVGIGVSISIGALGVSLRLRLHTKGVAGWQFLCGLGITRGGNISIEQLLSAPEDISCVVEGGPSISKAQALSVESMQRLGDVFAGRFFVEDWRNGDADSGGGETTEAMNAGATPLATVPVRFLTPQARSSWLTLRQIASVRSGVSTDWEPACHALSYDEMHALFGDEKGASALKAAEKFAYDHIWTPQPCAPLLPTLESGNETAELKLLEISRAGLIEALQSGSLGKTYGQAVYAERLEFELALICKMGFASYFLIVSEFCHWAKSHGISVGPGRGSGAGSLVARCIGITAVDPVEHNLYFERFLNPDRVSLPDFDVDFAEDRCHEVFAHIRAKYGQSSVARIATYSYLRGRSAIKEVGAAMGLPFNQVNELTTRYPHGVETISEALRDRHFSSILDRVSGGRQAVEVAARIEGVKRQAGLHPAGIVIAPGPVAHTAPVYAGEDGLVCAYDLKSAEASGLVKFDILSLSTLSVIDDAKLMIAAAARPAPLETNEVVPDDPLIFDMLANGHAVSVFQYDGMSDVLKKVKPTCFADLVALNALNRPGPIGEIPTYAARKMATEAGQVVDLDLPPPSELTLKTLGETYGIMVYQEQVMEISRLCAGFTLAQADMLRRAISKKIPEEVAAARASFVAGCQATQNIPIQDANALFSSIERFADYGFNKSHAVAYAHLGYVTAWYKRYHPDAWIAASIDRQDEPSRRDLLAEEARRFGVKIFGPDVNESDIRTTLAKPGSERGIRLGLSFIKGVGRGKSSAAAITVLARKAGPFLSIEDFAKRAGQAMSVSQMTALVEAGALDAMMPVRAEAIEILTALRSGRKSGPAAGKQASMFDDVADEAIAAASTRPAVAEFNDKRAREKMRLGFILSQGHGSVILERALNTKIAVRSAGGDSVIWHIQDVATCFDTAHAQKTAGQASGRLMSAVIIVGRTEEMDPRLIIKSGGRREAVRWAPRSSRQSENMQLMTEAVRTGDPVLCMLEWSLNKMGDVEMAVIDITPISEAKFDALPDDIRIKVASNDMPTHIHTVAERIFEALSVGGFPSSPPGRNSIILITDGVSRIVAPSPIEPTELAQDCILAMQGVEKLFLGKTEIKQRVIDTRHKVSASTPAM